jgi:hypothetical protein
MKEMHYFVALEKELESSFNYIEPDVDNMQCYGAKYSSLLNSISIEFESVCRSLIKFMDSEATVGNIGEIKQHMLTHFPKIAGIEVDIARVNESIKPLEEWPTSRLKWWDAYSTLKHNRISNYKKANLRNVIDAMISLLIVIAYLAKFRDSNKLFGHSNLFDMKSIPNTVIDGGEKLPDEP